MRVIAGKFKGIPLRGGRGPQFRPTTQLAKGSVFDTLYPDIQGAVVLDLFAGSGALGIEAVSRGAAKAVFVEQDKAILRALRTNLERCRIGPESAAVHSADVLPFLRKAIRSGEKYDLVIADPPYGSKLGEKLVEIFNAAEGRMFRIFILETGMEVQVPDGGKLEKYRTRKFGQTVVTYIRYREE